METKPALEPQSAPLSEAMHVQPPFDRWGNKNQNVGAHRIIVVGVNLSILDSVFLMMKLAAGAVPAIFVFGVLYELLTMAGCFGAH